MPPSHIDQILHRPVLDSDSELSEMDDSTIRPSKRSRTVLIHPSESESELSSIESIDASPKKKKQSKGKGKIKAKKVDIGEKKGKSKPARDFPAEDSDTLGATATGVKKEKVKKVLLAKEVFWNDMPDWAGKADCPLFELPLEILDRIFNPRMGLQVSVICGRGY
jgi:hypothetical protein